ncbi:MAG TPA: FHA domain-containing protein [Planctomycetota bacterium]
MGSDAACQLCIRGDGILPVHAYLRTDSDKVLIRPADASASSGTSVTGSITVNGQPLSGPITLIPGQEIALGGERLRLISEEVKPPPLLRRLWNRRWFRRMSWCTASLAVLILLAYSVLTLVILDEKALKNHIVKAVSAYLLRDMSETDIDSVQVKLLEGVATVKNLRIKERDTFAGSSSPFVEIPSLSVRVQIWPLVRSWFREYRGLQIVVNNPSVYIERSRTDGALNIQDILRKYAQRSGPAYLGLKHLACTLSVKDGKVRLRDEFTKTGDTSLEGINLNLSQDGLGQPLAIENCAMQFIAPAGTGTLSVSGHLSVLDAASYVNMSKISSDDLQVKMTRFDLARLFEHLGYAWAPPNTDFKVVLGKPITGQIAIKIKDPSHVDVESQGDGIRSESLISIMEPGRPPLGNIPMGLNFSLKLQDNGNGYLPHDMNIRLRSAADLSNPATNHLNFGASGRLNPGGVSAYIVDFDCVLERFLGTDVGKRLGLDGRLGGRLQGKAKLLREVNGSWKIDASMDLNPDDAYVMVPDPNDPNDPKKFKRQPLPLNFDFHASAQPDSAGGVKELKIEKFSLRAPSAVASSEVEGVIKGLDHSGELEAQAQFKLQLKGREFWNEFAPILGLFGFTQPIEEIFDLKVTLVGKHDIVSLAAVGTASRQWDPVPAAGPHDPAPVQLRTVLDFDRSLTTSKATNEKPYLSVILEFISTQGKPMFVHLDAACGRDDKTETLTAVLAAHDREKDQPLPGIRSDVVTLRQRFQPYIEGYLKRLDAQPGGGNWLKRYQQSVLQGELEQSGKLMVVRPLDPKSPRPTKVDFDFNIRGKQLDARLPLQFAGAAAPALWGWREEAVNAQIKGTYSHRLAENKEEPDTENLNLEKFKIEGSVGAFELKVQDLDVFKLCNLPRLANQTWTDCAASIQMAGQVDPPAFALARSLKWLPDEYPFCGALTVEAVFDRKKDVVDLKKFVFRQSEKSPISFLLHLDASGSLLRARDLSTRLLPVDAPATVVEQFGGLLDEGGPAVLLDHLGEQLAVESLQIDSSAFMEWARRTYTKERKQPEFLAAMLRGDWQPRDIWRAAGVKFQRTNANERAWQLVGAFRNDLTCKLGWPALWPHLGDPAQYGKATLSFDHDWALRTGVTVNPNDGTLTIYMEEADLDKAHIALALPALKYTFDKPAGQTCKLKLTPGHYTHTHGAEIGQLKFESTPLTVDVKDLRLLQGEPAQLAELVVRGGPLPCVITACRIDPATDKLQGNVSAPAAELAFLASIFPRTPPALKLSGTAKDLTASYKGSLISLRALIEPNTAALVRDLKLEAEDPRLKGLNTESDILEIKGEASGAQMAAGITDAERVSLQLGGKLRITPRNFSCDGFALTMQQGTGPAALKQTVTAPVLRADSTNPKLTLAQACKAPGLPLNLSADLAFSTSFNPAAWLSAGDVLINAVTGAAAPKPGSERRVADLEHLVFTGGMTAPEANIGELTLKPFDAKSLSFKALHLNVKSLTTSFYNGKLELFDSDFDLGKTGVAPLQGRLQIKPVAFNTRLKLLDADVSQIVGGVAKNGYALASTGKVGAQGTLSGVNFTGLERHTWEGAVKLQLAPFAILAPPPATAGTEAGATAPWAKPYLRLGPKFFGAFLKASGAEAVNLPELTRELALEESTQPLNGFALMLQTYLAKAFAFDTNRLDFASAEPTVTITHGFASIDPLLLVGRNACAGLDLQLKNLKINLADETFADDLVIFPAAIPESSRQRLVLQQWPAAEQQAFLRETETRLPLRVSGRLCAASAKFPWPQLTSLGRRALFGTDKINDLIELEQARQHLARVWVAGPGLEKAASLADLASVGLPGTLGARQQGQTMLDRVPNLPLRLQEKLSVSSELITPMESLELLLNPEPLPPNGRNVKPPTKAPTPEPK